MNSCSHNVEELSAVGGGGQARSGFHQIKSKFLAAKPSMLAPLLPPETPLATSAMNNDEQ